MQHAWILLIEKIWFEFWEPIFGDESFNGSKNSYQDDPRLTWEEFVQTHQHREEYKERYKCIHVQLWCMLEAFSYVFNE